MAEAAEKERKILVAVDEGEESCYALTWCLANVVNQNSKDTLILLYARPPRAVYSTLDGSGEEHHLPGEVNLSFLSTKINLLSNSLYGHFSNFAVILIMWNIYNFIYFWFFSVYFLFFEGYLFSSDILATMEKYSQEVAECVIEKAQRICKGSNDVSILLLLLSFFFFYKL